MDLRSSLTFEYFASRSLYSCESVVLVLPQDVMPAPRMNAMIAATTGFPDLWLCR